MFDCLVCVGVGICFGILIGVIISKKYEETVKRPRINDCYGGKGTYKRGYTFGSRENRNIQPPKIIKPKCVSIGGAGYQG